MGFRTVVVLNNDQAHIWQADPELGRKIMLAASIKSYGRDAALARYELPYGEVVEQVHADTQTVALLDGYGGRAISHTHWYRDQTQEQRDVEALKAMADKLGFRIVRKSKVK